MKRTLIYELKGKSIKCILHAYFEKTLMPGDIINISLADAVLKREIQGKYVVTEREHEITIQSDQKIYHPDNVIYQMEKIIVKRIS